MSINEAIIKNDQYNKALKDIEALQSSMLIVDIESSGLWDKLESNLNDMFNVICDKKHKLKNAIKL
jgi:hypothetical protein